MGRLLVLCLAAGGFSLDNCGDDPVGPQPDKPIRPPQGYTGEPPPEPGQPPAPVPAGGTGGSAAAQPSPSPAPAAAAAPDQPKCPKDAASLVTAKAHPAPKDKKKRVELKLSGKTGITFK